MEDEAAAATPNRQPPSTSADIAHNLLEIARQRHPLPDPDQALFMLMNPAITIEEVSVAYDTIRCLRAQSEESLVSIIRLREQLQVMVDSLDQQYPPPSIDLSGLQPNGNDITETNPPQPGTTVLDLPRTPIGDQAKADDDTKNSS